jgi:hypothetical protein
VHAERQRLGQARERELDDDQAGDDPVKDLRQGRIARRLSWHRRAPRAHCRACQSSKRGFQKLRKHLSAAALALLLAACGAPPARPAGPARPPRRRPPSAHRARNSVSHRFVALRAAPTRVPSRGHGRPGSRPRHRQSRTRGIGQSGRAPRERRFFLSIPTSGFVVDEAAARAQEGADFSEEIGDDAKAGTLHNMLSPAVLDAQSHASITVHSISIEPAPGDAQVPPAALQATVRVVRGGTRGEPRRALHGADLCGAAARPGCVHGATDRSRAHTLHRSSGRAARRGSSAREARSRRHPRLDAVGLDAVG